MAHFFSEHYAAPSSPTVEPAGIVDLARHSETEIKTADLHWRWARFDFTANATAFTTSDVLRCFPVKSGDRISHIYFSTEPTDWTYDSIEVSLDLHLQGSGNNGDSVSAMWGVGDATAAALAYKDVYNINGAATVPNDAHRLMPVWAIMDEKGTTSYGADPVITYDLCLTFTDIDDNNHSTNGAFAVGMLYSAAV